MIEVNKFVLDDIPNVFVFVLSLAKLFMLRINENIILIQFYYIFN